MFILWPVPLVQAVQPDVGDIVLIANDTHHIVLLNARYRESLRCADRTEPPSCGIYDPPGLFDWLWPEVVLVLVLANPEIPLIVDEESVIGGLVFGYREMIRWRSDFSR